MLTFGRGTRGPYWLSMQSGHPRTECWILPVSIGDQVFYEVMVLASDTLNYSRRHASAAAARIDADERLLDLVTRSTLKGN